MENQLRDTVLENLQEGGEEGEVRGWGIEKRELGRHYQTHLLLKLVLYLQFGV